LLAHRLPRYFIKARAGTWRLPDAKDARQLVPGSVSPRVQRHEQEETVITKTLRGKVHGKTIELDEDLGVVDGQEVEVQVKIVRLKKRLPGPPPGWQAGKPSTTAGMLADAWTEEDDRILEEIHRDRKREIRREHPE
jgi:hypothetical protein